MEIGKLIVFLQDALLDDPDNHDIRIKLASAYMNNDDHEKARRQIEIVLEKDPVNEMATHLLAFIDNELEFDEEEEEMEDEPQEEKET